MIYSVEGYSITHEIDEFDPMRKEYYAYEFDIGTQFLRVYLTARLDSHTLSECNWIHFINRNNEECNCLINIANIIAIKEFPKEE